MKSTATRLLCGLAALLTIVILAVPAAFAQTGTIEGTVTDAETGESIPGANVTLTQINRGAATNIDGEYSIEDIPVGTYTFQVSFVGYQRFSTEVTIEGGEVITQDVELETGAVGLEEVVVTGYGQQQEEIDATGSVSGFTAEEIEGMPGQNAEQFLSARTTGVTVTQTSGNPGSGFEVNIRGQGSITGGNDPLYIVDGVQMSQNLGSENTDRNALNAIKPQDIESIQVLKDAAAAGIYGAQAANGVVIIETKSGRAGQTEVSVSMEGGIRSSIANFNSLSPQEWADFNIDAFNELAPGQGEELFRNSFLPNQYGLEPGSSIDDIRTTDWRDRITRNGSHRSIRLSASGGNETTQYFLSGSWENTQAGVRNVEFETFNFRTNVTQQLTDNFRVRLNATIADEEQISICQDGFFINCPWSGIQFEPPVTRPRNDDGTFFSGTTFGQSNNQEVILTQISSPTAITQIIGSVRPRLEITPWLSLNGNFGLDYTQQKEKDIENTIANPGDGGFLDTDNNDLTNITLNTTLNLNKTFGEAHSVNALIGGEYRREFEEGSSFGVIGFNQDLLNVPDAASEVNFFNGSNTEFRLLSYFQNFDYTYDSRYSLQLSTRWDGTSRFGSQNQFGFFPSVSASWNIAREDFFNAGFVEELKLRANWGQTGNSQIGNFPARGLFSTSGTFEGQVGFNPSQLANPTLTWEEKRTINVGLDFALLRNRVTGSVEVFDETTDELLLGRPLPTSSGFGSFDDNVGEVENRGIEFQVETVNLQTEEFRWTTRFNGTIISNQVNSLVGDQEELFSGASRPVEVGRPIEGWKVPRWAGVNPADGRPMWFDEDGNITYQTDVNDRVPFDGAERDLVGGFGTTLQWQGLTLDALFQLQYGGTTEPETIQFFLWEQGPFNSGIEKLTERWREPGDIAPVPRAVPGGTFPNAQSFTTSSSFHLWDTSFLRFKNVRLGYSFPEQVLNALGLSDLRIYVSGENLVTWSSFIGLDPGVANPETETSFPNERQINFGINLNI